MGLGGWDKGEKVVMATERWKCIKKHWKYLAKRDPRTLILGEISKKLENPPISKCQNFPTRKQVHRSE